jgi:hypothetical protein
MIEATWRNKPRPSVAKRHHAEAVAALVASLGMVAWLSVAALVDSPIGLSRVATAGVAAAGDGLHPGGAVQKYRGVLSDTPVFPRMKIPQMRIFGGARYGTTQETECFA